MRWGRQRVRAMRRPAPTGPCLEGCGVRATTRGLCRQHYGALSRLVARGGATWEQLEQERRALPPAPNKYNARATVVYGERMGSQLEAEFFCYAKARELTGKVLEVRAHPRYELLPGMHYVADVEYVEADTGRRLTFDAKGGSTKSGRFPSVCAVWRFMMDHPLVVVERDGGDFKVTRTILPKPLPVGWRGRDTRAGLSGPASEV